MVLSIRQRFHSSLQHPTDIFLRICTEDIEQKPYIKRSLLHGGRSSLRAFGHPFREGMPERSIFSPLFIEVGPWARIEVGGAAEVYSLTGVKVFPGVTEFPSDIRQLIIP